MQVNVPRRVCLWWVEQSKRGNLSYPGVAPRVAACSAHRRHRCHLTWCGVAKSCLKEALCWSFFLYYEQFRTKSSKSFMYFLRSIIKYLGVWMLKSNTPYFQWSSNFLHQWWPSKPRVFDGSLGFGWWHQIPRGLNFGWYHSFENDKWKCKPLLIQPQIIATDSSQCPLSKHASPPCEKEKTRIL